MGNNLFDAGGQKSPVAEFGMVGSIATWCECLQGRAPLKIAIKKLARSLDVEAVALSRVSTDGVDSAQSLCFDMAEIDECVPVLERSYAHVVLGPYLRHSKHASVWLKSIAGGEIDPRLESFHNRRNLTELAVITLSAEEKCAFFLELHFSARLGSGHHDMINMCASTLADTWSNRKPGLMTELILRRRQPERQVGMDAPLLSAENPARLSRAEFRICLLLSRGLSAKAVRQELKISESTLRTHLRNIYAKTSSNNQSELVYNLLSKRENRPSAASEVA